MKDENKFTYWLEHKAENCGLCDPPLDAQKAVNFLKKYLLGDSWYVAVSENTSQVNCAAVHQILLKYSKEYRKEYKKYKKGLIKTVTIE